MVFQEVALFIAIGLIGGRLAYVSYKIQGPAQQTTPSGSMQGHMWSLGALGVAAALTLVFG